MKKILLTLFLMGGMITGAWAQNASDLSWGQICSGKMPADWNGSEEAVKIADKLVDQQKNSGGWMKNIEFHKANDTGGKNEHSCLDNVATTMEMRYLAKVWKKTGTAKYQESFKKALNMIFTAEKKVGGWSQYWPLTGGDSYQDYITFNDDLVTNVMKMLQSIIGNKGDFADIVDADTRTKCQQSLDKSISMIINCQVDDNGTKAAWCAQHDPEDLLPMEGRPHELPSISGSESASLLSFLMTIENPSEELQNCIHSAVAWLDAHKYKDNAAVEDFTNAAGEADRHIVDKQGSAVWGRFIQLGGETGKANYKKFFDKLYNRGKSRSHTQNGKSYSYTEYEIASKSYNPDKAYQPIFAIYDDGLQHLYYRFLYNYEDTPDAPDWKGCTVPTSLNALRRTKYQFMGSWPLNVIKSEYPAWKQRISGGGLDAYAIQNNDENVGADQTISVVDGVTMKFSNVEWTIGGSASAAQEVDGVQLTGKYATTASNGNPVYFTTTKPGKLTIFFGGGIAPTKGIFMTDGENGLTGKVLSTGTEVPNGSNSHEDIAAWDGLVYTLEAGKTYEFKATGTKWRLAGFKYETTATGISTIKANQSDNSAIYNLQGVRIDNPTKGIYIQNGKKIVVK